MEYYVTFQKTGWMRYISHLDLSRLLGRAMRRAELPFELSQGFSPHIKLKFKRALRLGLESSAEECAFSLTHPLRPEEVKGQLQAQLPDGITIKEITCLKKF